MGKHTEDDDDHIIYMHRKEQTRSFGGFVGDYEGITTCFVCDQEVSAADIKAALCPLCNTVLNHTTIKCKKISPKAAVPKTAVQQFHATSQKDATSAAAC